jgi:hypothetical protein
MPMQTVAERLKNLQDEAREYHDNYRTALREGDINHAALWEHLCAEVNRAIRKLLTTNQPRKRAYK